MTPKLLLLLGLLAVALSSATAIQFTDSKDTIGSFNVCGSEKRFCIGVNSECNAARKCACKDGFHGVPQLGCYSTGVQICSVISDPKLTGYAGLPHKGVDVAMPCSFTASEVVAENKIRRGDKYQITVRVGQRRVHGNFYASGFDAEVFFYNIQEDLSGFWRFKAYGEADNGVYKYRLTAYDSQQRETTNVGSVAFGMTSYVGGSTRFHYDRASNRVELSVPTGGLTIYFRPADQSIRKVQDQTQVPGVTIGLDENIVDVTYPTQVIDSRDSSTHAAACLHPNPQVLSIADVATEYNMKLSDSLLYHSLNYLPTQDFPGINGGLCTNVSKLLRESCSHSKARDEVLMMCDFILDKRPFVNCYSRTPDSSDLLVLLEQCIKTYCPSGSVLDSCRDMQRRIKETGCKAQANKLDVDIDCEKLAADAGELQL